MQPTSNIRPGSITPAQPSLLPQKPALNGSTVSLFRSRPSVSVRDSDLINVCFGPLCGLKSDISRIPC
jgi:hypothetical protein